MTSAADAVIAGFEAHVAAIARLVTEIEKLTDTLRALAPLCRAHARARRRLLRARRRACLRHLGHVPPKPPRWPDVPLSRDEKQAVLTRVLAQDAAARPGAAA